MIQVRRTPGGKAEAIDLTPEGRELTEVLNMGMNKGREYVVGIDDTTFEAVLDRAGRELRTVNMQIVVMLRQALGRVKHADIPNGI